ncbi:hypothetical protein NO1_0346 [Candidatus Termititenax aidoneus]|uniref:Conjugal transfer protein n=1 Tax=Termititenax aidoneus TaxID=2218524 RepID=A0A388T935_TERA1|nr:hypothetical protein NO1_0346 [Candidatus Termititenax aidoneus]
MTGKKNQKPKDWTGNKHSVHMSIGSRNLALHDREMHDFYATEPKATELLLELDNFSDVWECACGQGHMAKVLKKQGILKLATDKYNYGYGKHYDFLASPTDKQDYISKWHGDIITNPPYKYANEFMKKALEILDCNRKLALFLPIRYLESKTRKKIFTENPPKKIWVSSSRLNCARNGDFVTFPTNSTICYAWFIWEKGYKGKTELDWFN